METAAAQPMSAVSWKPKRNNHTVYVLDRLGRIIDTNETVSPLTGFSLEDLAGSRLSEYLDPAAGSSLKGLLEGRDRENQAALETMIRCRDGRQRPVRGMRVCFRDEDENCSGVMVYLEPALAWIAPEPSVAVGEEDGLAQMVSDAVIDVAADQNVVSINAAGRGMFECGDDGEGWSLSLRSLFDPLELDRAVSALSGPGETFSPLVAVLRRMDGKRFIGKVSAQRTAGGGLRLVIQNLSSDREIERLGLALENSSRAGRFSFALVDSDERIVFLDPGFAALFGCERWEKMIGFQIGGFIRGQGADDRDEDMFCGPDKALLNLPGPDAAGRWKRISLVGLGVYKLVIASRP